MARPCPTLLTQQQSILLDALRRGHPVPVERLIVVLYADRADGGPDDAVGTVRTQISYLRIRLEPHGVAILTVGRDGYMVDPDHLDRLSTLLDAKPAIDLGRARQLAFALPR